jgi:hexosaminidase
MNIRFRLLIGILLFAVVFSAFSAGKDQIAIVPKPRSVKTETASLKLNNVFHICDISGKDQHWASFVNNIAITGIDYKCVSSTDPKSEITISISPGSAAAEGYSLTITAKGIAIVAPDRAGALYAIETLRQILMQSWNGNSFTIPCMTVQDEPAFAFRGFMLDASRHFQPVATVKHVLDYMLAMKLNVFHWHLSDDQGWRVQSLKHPELNSIGSFINDSDRVQTNGFYSIEEIHDIINYAAERNIKIIPEFDIPGHSMAVLSAFPKLRCPYKPNSNAFCAGNDETYKILKDIFAELIDIFKPEYIHIGGDERQKDLWNKCDLCKAKMKTEGVTNENDLQSKMLIEISGFIHSKGVKTISWAENIEGGVAAGQIIQSWRLRDEAFKAVKLGHQVINSDNGETYLDYPENAEEAKVKPSWMIILPVEKVYNFNPIPKGITKEEEKLIMGSECPLWTEMITIDKIYPQVRNRLEAHAEKCWTPAAQKNFEDFSARMKVLGNYFKAQFYAETTGMF